MVRVVGYSPPRNTIEGIHEKGSFVLGDGLSPLGSGEHWMTWSTATADGRIVFTVGNWTNMASMNGNQRSTKFDMDVIDTQQCRRKRISSCDPLHEYGRTIGFYALSSELVVLVDEMERGVRQTLIRIDHDSELIRCRTIFERFYRLNLSDAIDVSVGEEIVVIADDNSAFVMPKNPQCSDPHKDITPLLGQAEAILMARLGDNARISERPFIISATAIGYFIELEDDESIEGGHCPSEIVVIDMINGISVQPIQGNPRCLEMFFSESAVELCPEFYQANDKEVVLTAMHKDFVAVLKTSTLQLVHLQVCGFRLYDILPSPDGLHIVAMDDKTQRFRIFSSPFSVPSLVRLAAKAVRRNRLLSIAEIEHLAQRFQ